MGVIMERFRFILFVFLILFGSCDIKPDANSRIELIDSVEEVEKSIINFEAFFNNNEKVRVNLLNYSIIDSSTISFGNDELKIKNLNDSVFFENEIENINSKGLKSFFNSVQILKRNGIEGGYYSGAVGSIMYPYKTIYEEFEFYTDYTIILNTKKLDHNKLNKFYNIVDRKSNLILVYGKGSQ